MRATLRCYVYLLIWIVIFSAALYWFLTSTESENGKVLDIANGKGLNPQISLQEAKDRSQNDWLKSIKTDEAVAVQFVNQETSQDDQEVVGGEVKSEGLVNRLCNAQELIQAKEENFKHQSYKLDAIVLIIRHGDRGPLSHVGKRNVSHINCKGQVHKDFPALYRFATESIAKIPGYSQFIGPFHGFPKVPTSSVCHLGQLTQVGSSQLLHLGQIIRARYKGTLPLGNLKEGGGGRVIAYSTRYRRTLQSLIAFLYGFLGPKVIIPSVTVRESQSITFCFNDCSCRAADRLQKKAQRIYNAFPEEKSKKMSLMNHINSILELEKNKKTGMSLLDLLLVYPCHKAPLPCRSSSSLVSNPLLHSPSESETSTSANCITNESLVSLIRHIRKETLGLQNILEQRQHSLLSSYGLLREILGLSLKMTSSQNRDTSQSQSLKSRVAIFSGHDTTLQSLIGALGVYRGHPDIPLPPFASRLIFEFYRKVNVSPMSPRKHFFRVVYNGYSITHLISFCKRIYRRRKTESGIATKEFLCPLENLVRFMHDNYFESFGNSTTNFRDACR